MGALLEKELILEEVAALSDKLRQQAVDGRQGTMELSQKVNQFQSRIKGVTRKMMSTVSELSMYQATAHKLQAERDDACERMMTARERVRMACHPQTLLTLSLIKCCRWSSRGRLTSSCQHSESRRRTL